MAHPSLYQNLSRHILQKDVVTQRRFLTYLQGFLWSDAQLFFEMVQSYTGTVLLDPTTDLDLVSFCLSIPQCVYQNQDGDRRLVREGLKADLPDGLRCNTLKGKQGAYWLDYFHRHAASFLPLLDFAQSHDAVQSLVNVPRLLAEMDRFMAWSVEDMTQVSAQDLNRVYRSQVSRALVVLAFLRRVLS